MVHIILNSYALERGLQFEVNAVTDIKRITAHITAHLEAIFMGNKEKQLYEKFEEINNIFETKERIIYFAPLVFLHS